MTVTEYVSGNGNLYVILVVPGGSIRYRPKDQSWWIEGNSYGCRDTFVGAQREVEKQFGTGYMVDTVIAKMREVRDEWAGKVAA